MELVWPQPKVIIHRWYEQIGLPLCESYGLSECAPVLNSFPDSRKIGVIGKPAKGIQIKIADSGEILIKAKCQKPIIWINCVWFG